MTVLNMLETTLKFNHIEILIYDYCFKRDFANSYLQKQI